MNSVISRGDDLPGISKGALPLARGKGAVLLHGFIKKTRKTPPKEIDLALKRMKGQDL
jgi:hypothetical protein